jgi:sirohydrochlorin ferrochelatase
MAFFQGRGGGDLCLFPALLLEARHGKKVIPSEHDQDR